MRRGFTIHHNGPPANCIGKPHARCIAFWGAVVAYHVSDPPKGQGWSGVAYSFGVCPHGVRFTGQGWDRRQFANGADLVGDNDGRDSEWYTVLAFVGGGPGTGDPEEKPTPEMTAGVGALIEEGRRTVRCDSRVLPHNAFKNKPCPGPTFEALARRWDNQPITIEEEDDMALFENVGDFEEAVERAVRRGVEAELTTQGDPTRTAILELSRRGSLYGDDQLVIPDDFVQGGLVYFTDFKTKVSFPQGSPRHRQIQADLAAQGLSTNARRIPQSVLDAIEDEVDQDPEPGPTG